LSTTLQTDHHITIKSAKNNFDFLRLLLAFIVVCSHIVVLSGSASLQAYAVFFPSNLAVCGFFIISGLLISGSYYRDPRLSVYLQKRARRLLPAYISVVLLCAALLVFVSGYHPSSWFFSREWWQYTISNLFFLNFLQPNLPGVFRHNPETVINGALWSIKIEVMFYLILPFILRWLLRPGKVLIKLSGIYIGSLIYRYGLEGLGHYSGHSFWNLLSYQLPGYMSYFACGIALFLYRDRFQRVPHYLMLLALLILLLELKFSYTLLRPAALAVLIYYVATRFSFLNHFGKYGDFSYGVYIFHFPLIQLAVYLGWFANDAHAIWHALALLPMCLLAGVLSWYLIEKRWLRR